MNERSYSDFDLVIEQSGDRYRARVINSPAGQASVEFDSLFSLLELENFVLRMGRPQRGMRRIDSTEMEAIKSFGTRLFRTVFNDDIYACYLRSMDNVLNQNKGLRIRLRINVPELHDLPWEYLYNPQFDQFLALSKDTPIIRYIELPYTTQALPVITPMKILVMISSPEGYPSLDVEEEWRRLNMALKPLIDQGLVILEKLEHPTLSALQQQLRRDQVHIFHYIGHGKYFEHKQDGMLLLEDESQRGIPTSGQHLGAILHDHHSLRLVVLNACEGARTSAEDPYTGVAQTLIRQGIPAVIAMQFEIFEDAAITLAQEFYSAIVDGYPVDAALSEARKAVFASNNDVEWGTPVLYMRTPDGVLFKPETAAEKDARLATERLAAEKAAFAGAEPEAVEKDAQEQRISLLNRLYDQAKNQLTIQDWSGASDSLVQIRGIEPGFRDVAALMEQAQTAKDRQEKFVGFIALGKQDLEKHNWMKAIETFQQALVLDSGNIEAQALLAEAESGGKVQDLFNSAQMDLHAEQWSDAIAKFQAILELEPAHVEASRQLAGAKIKLAQQIQEDKNKTTAKSEESISTLMKSSSFPEEIKLSKPSSLPEKIKLRRKPKDLPK